MFNAFLVSCLWALSSSISLAIVDINFNGASDIWEKHFNDGNLYTTFDPQADSDGDGWTNQQEAITGTDPTDGTPPVGFLRPEIEHIPAVYLSPEEEGGMPTLQSPETTTIRWTTLPGKQYTLFSSADLTSSSWLPVGEAFIGSGSEMTYGFPFMAPEDTPGKLFWRVSTEDVDSDGDTLTNSEEHQMGTNAHLRDLDADGMDDNVDPQPNVGFPSFADADKDGIPDEYDSQPNVSDGVAPTISSETATISRIINVTAEDSLAFLVNVENPSGLPVTAANLKLFVSGVEESSANFTQTGGNQFAVTWTARVHEDYPAKVLENLSVRFEDARKATAWLELARLDVAEWQGMVAGLVVHYHNIHTRTFSIGGHSAGIHMTPGLWSGAYGDGARWYRGPRSVKFYGVELEDDGPGLEMGELSIGAGMRYPLFIIDDSGKPAAPGVTVRDISNPLQYPHGFWGLNQYSGQIKVEGTGATSLIAPSSSDFLSLPQPGAEDTAYAYEAKFLENGQWEPIHNNFMLMKARTSARAMHALTTAPSGSIANPTALDWRLEVPIEDNIVASAAGSLDYPGLPLDNLQEEKPLFLAPTQWHRIVIKVGPDVAVVARGVQLRLNIGAVGTAAAQPGFEFKRKTATGFESFTPGEILEGSPVYNELTGQSGLVLFAKLSATTDQLHRLSRDLLPNSSTLEPLEIRSQELVPIHIYDNSPATGVDDLSLTADSSDIGYQSRFWIMAPSGVVPPGYGTNSGIECSNDVKIKIPLVPSSKLVMEFPKPDCEYRHPVTAAAGASSITLGHSLEPSVRWHGTVAETRDTTPTFKFGANSQVTDLPIRVKTMKKRTVKVAVWPMRLNGAPNVALSEGLKSTIRTKLDQIIAYQTNAWFDVDFKNGEEADYLDGTEVVPVGDGTNIITQYTLAAGAREKAMISAFNDSNADINLYLLNGVSYRLLVGGVQLGLSGWSYPSQDPTSGIYQNSCVVETDGHNNDDIADSVVHEVGHLLVGGGHPDQNGGAAPLPSLASEHIKRLMHSDVGHPGLLVKSEWDKAEKWLTKFPDKRIFDSTGQTGNY